MVDMGGGLLRERPVGNELVVVKLSPLLDEVHRRPRKRASDRRTVVDPDQRLVLAVQGMEVRRIVIDEVHVDHDAVELAQPRYLNNLRRHGSRP